jgi:hypothetical protein
MCDNPKILIPFIIFIIAFTYACLEYNYGNKELATTIFALSIIGGIPMWMIVKALTNNKI